MYIFVRIVSWITINNLALLRLQHHDGYKSTEAIVELQSKERTRSLSITCNMKVVIAVFIAIGWGCHSVIAQEKVCSNFCSSLGMLQSSPGESCDDIYQINKASRGASGNYWINTTTGVH